MSRELLQDAITMVQQLRQEVILQAIAGGLPQHKAENLPVVKAADKFLEKAGAS
jgi:hypothetical protein